MKLELINRIREIYKENSNIMEYLKNSEQRTYNLPEDIMISYDFQAGRYNQRYKENKSTYMLYHNEISKIINKYINQVEIEGGGIL